MQRQSRAGRPGVSQDLASFNPYGDTDYQPGCCCERPQLRVRFQQAIYKQKQTHNKHTVVERGHIMIHHDASTNLQSLAQLYQCIVQQQIPWTVRDAN